MIATVLAMKQLKSYSAWCAGLDLRTNAWCAGLAAWCAGLDLRINAWCAGLALNRAWRA
jgi:hypothetical protein